MEDCSNRNEASPQLLDLIPKDREWPLQREERKSHGSSEEKKLELRLGPPGEDCTIKNEIGNNSRERDDSILSLGYYSNMPYLTHNSDNQKRSFADTWVMSNNGSLNQKLSLSETPVGAAYSSSPWSQLHQLTNASLLKIQTNPQGLSVMTKESSQRCSNKAADLQNAEKKAFSPASANTAVPNSSQKRSAPIPVVGWPPIRSFRKNLATSTSSKPNAESQNEVLSKAARERPVESCKKGLFVKINMDGVPIGRKVDLKACDSYDKLSCAVDELFRGLLAAQRDYSAGGMENKQEGEKAITGLLDGSGEYTLVYEDNEGDRVLVGDVPWHMFVSNVKRLRVLKSSDVSTLSLNRTKEKNPT